MESMLSQQSKTKSSRKSRISPGHDEVEVANVAAEQTAERGRQNVSSNNKLSQTVVTAAPTSKSRVPTPPRGPRPMLQGNILISGGQFVQTENVTSNVNNARDEAFKRLQEHVAPAAFHSSAQRIDPPRCHPNTRVAIMQTIYDWIMQSDDRERWVMWLNGAAGAGKSAIMQSLAERSVQEAIAIASFFFFREDPTRNSIWPLVATLVYQLIQAIPALSNGILQIIERDPLIFSQSLEFQIQQLIVQPLLRLPPRLQRLFVVFIDGLDECNDRKVQANLIKVLGNVHKGKNNRVIFLIASRREPQIEAEFVRNPVDEILQILPLDNSDLEQTSNDIRHFLMDKFSDIKKTHLFKRYLPDSWPAASVIEEIVAKSSGQFIFTSVVINYLSSPRANPSKQLEIICGIRLRKPSSQNPFAHLDALYQHIFSQVEALDKVFDIMAFVLLAPGHGAPAIQQTFGLEAGDLEVLFADLTAVISCERHSQKNATLKFLHASLPDFLLDKSRSEQYYIDLTEYRTKLLCKFLERPPLDLLRSGDNLMFVMDREQDRLAAIRSLLAGTKASEQLCSAFMKFDCTFYTKIFLHRPWYDIGPDILRHLKRLDFNDQGKAYCHVVNVFAAEYAKYWSSLYVYDKYSIEQTSPDLMARINQILKPKRLSFGVFQAISGVIRKCMQIVASG